MARPRERDLTIGPIGEHVRALAVPSALSLLFLTLYNVTDTVFAGWVSTEAQAGLGLGGQLFFLVPALGVGFRIGGAAVVGQLFGAQKRDEAREASIQVVLASVLVTVATMVLGAVLFGPLVDQVAAGQAYGKAAHEYILWMLFATPGFVIAYAISGLLDAQGDAQSLARAQFTSSMLNILLNPLFVFGIPGVVEGLGLRGIALATVVCQNGVLAYLGWRALQTPALAFRGFSDLRPHFEVWGKLSKQIAPATARLLVIVVGGYLTQLWLRPFGEDAVAGYNVGLRLEQLLLLPAIGITGSILPFTSQNMGASKPERIRHAFWLSVGFAAALMGLGTLLIWTVGPVLVDLFGAGAEARRLALQYLRVESVVLPIFALLFGLQNLLQGLQQPLWPLGVGVWRQGIGIAVLGAFYIAWLELGPLGMWLTVATGVVTSTVVLVFVAARIVAEAGIDLRPTWLGGTATRG